MIKILKLIFNHSNVSIEDCNNLISNWIELLEEVDSVFLNQLVFFTISTRPAVFKEETLKKLLKHYLENVKNKVLFSSFMINYFSNNYINKNIWLLRIFAK